MEYGHSPHMYDSRIDVRQKWINLSLLIFVNFMNYTDRYTLAGIVIDIQEYFKIKNDSAGLIQTVFITVYTVFAPIFGYFGDRYNRKILLSFGVILWSASNLAASFVTEFWAFLIFRAAFGVGQACYTTVAPSIISDLVVGDMRSRLFALFYLAIPVGNGLGYIVGTQMTAAFGDWKWSLRASPFFALLNVSLLMCVLKEPKRGEVEEAVALRKTSWYQDIRYLVTNPSFMFSTLGFTTVAFTTGAVHWWNPKLNYLGFRSGDPLVDSHAEGSVFGIVSLFSGFFGICVGYVSTFKLKPRLPAIDPLACGIGLVLSGPLLIAATYASLFSRTLTYILQFHGFVFMNLNWAINVDICLYVVVPWRRGSAMGMQLLLGHALGDAGSPYLAGLMSELLFDHFQSVQKDSLNEFRALQYACITACAFEILGSSFFFLNAFYVKRDIERARRDTQEASDERQAEAST